MKLVTRICIIGFFLNLKVIYSTLAQDPQVSQPFAISSTLSPAFTGIHFKDNVQLLYRNQFPTLGVSYTFGLVNINMILPKIQSGLGLSASYDEQFKNLKTTNISLRYAYHIILSKKSILSAGIEGGWQHRAIDFKNYVFPNYATGSLNANSFDPTINSLANSSNFFDLGVGILYYTSKSWIGISSHHINQPNQSVGIGSIDILNRKYSLQMGTNFTLSNLNESPVNISPVIYLKKQGELIQLDLGSYLNVGAIELGLWYRGVPLISNSSGNESLVALIGYSATDYNIGFSHDFLISGLMGFASGANEITVGFYFNRDKENVLRKFLNKRGKLSCPKF